MKVNVSVLFLGKSKMQAPSKRRKFSQIFCSHHFFFLILAFFNLSPCALSFWPHSISFCNFGHMCSFLFWVMPCDKTFVIFAIKFNSGYISRKSTNKYRKLNSSHPKMTEIYYGFLVSKETVVLCRWGRSKQKFGFIKRVDKC